MSFALALWLSFPSLRNLPATGQQKLPGVHLYAYSVLTLLAMLAITMLTNVDVILARNFFPPDDAGNYSAISVLGRVAFYAPIGITAAMFPKTSNLFETSGKHERLFLKAMVLVLFVTGTVVLIYGLFPSIINNFVFGIKYPVISAHLFTYGLAMALFGFSFFLMTYLLSLNQTGVAYLLIGIALVQIILLSLFHTNIAMMINIMLSCGTICVISLILYILTTSLRRKTNDGH
jgi:O-antigen/teichoic acid export membrane protein